MQKRMYKGFNAEELEIIKENIDKVTLIKLAEILGRSYSNVSGGLKQHRIFFRPISKNREKELIPQPAEPKGKPLIEKKFNKKQEMLTDELMKSWFYN